MFLAHKHYERHLINAAKLVSDNFTVVWKQKSTTGGKDGSAALLFTQPLDKVCIITMVYMYNYLQQGTKKLGYLEKGRGVFLWILLFFLPFSQEVYKRRKQLTLTDWLNRVKKRLHKMHGGGNQPQDMMKLLCKALSSQINLSFLGKHVL